MCPYDSRYPHSTQTLYRYGTLYTNTLDKLRATLYTLSMHLPCVLVPPRHPLQWVLCSYRVPAHVLARASSIASMSTRRSLIASSIVSTIELDYTTASSQSPPMKAGSLLSTMDMTSSTAT